MHLNQNNIDSLTQAAQLARMHSTPMQLAPEVLLELLDVYTEQTLHTCRHCSLSAWRPLGVEWVCPVCN